MYLHYNSEFNVKGRWPRRKIYRFYQNPGSKQLFLGNYLKGREIGADIHNDPRNLFLGHER